MRSAIRNVQMQVGITTIYVSLNQEKALAISDRIVGMKGGIIQQLENLKLSIPGLIILLSRHLWIILIFLTGSMERMQ